MIPGKKAANAAQEQATKDSEQRLCLKIMTAIGEGNYSTITVIRALAAAAAAEIVGVAPMLDCGTGHLPPDVIVEKLAGMLHTLARDLAYETILAVEATDQVGNLKAVDKNVN